MRRYEREVIEHDIIAAMLDQMQIVNVGLNDKDGWPYVVPMSFGYEATDEGITVYTHFTKKGKKLELMRADNRVCLEFSIFSDFPDRKYKGHYHDYRSVICRGRMEIVDYADDPATWERGYNLLYTCNGREIKPLSDRAKIPPMYIGVVCCPWDDVTAKSEFPLRSVSDVPFSDVYALPQDEVPFDISDIVAARKERRKELAGKGQKELAGKGQK